MELVEVSLRLGFPRVLVVENLGEIAADHEQRGQRLAGSAEGALAVMDGLFKFTLPGCYDAEG